MNSIQYKILDPRLGDLWPAPAYATKMAAGMDLRAMLHAQMVLEPGHVELVGTGLALHINDNHSCAIILPRSGLGHSKGLVLGNLTGLIDADYQGEIKVSLWNRSSQPVVIEPGDRVAQLVFLPIIRPLLTRVEDFGHSARGVGGFGHTGVA